MNNKVECRADENGQHRTFTCMLGVDENEFIENFEGILWQRYRVHC